MCTFEQGPEHHRHINASGAKLRTSTGYSSLLLLWSPTRHSCPPWRGAEYIGGHTALDNDCQNSADQWFATSAHYEMLQGWICASTGLPVSFISHRIRDGKSSHAQTQEHAFFYNIARSIWIPARQAWPDVRLLPKYRVLLSLAGLANDSSVPRIGCYVWLRNSRSALRC